MSMAAFLIQLGLHGLTGALACLVGLKLGMVEAAGPGGAALGSLALAVLAIGVPRSAPGSARPAGPGAVGSRTPCAPRRRRSTIWCATMR